VEEYPVPHRSPHLPVHCQGLRAGRVGADEAPATRLSDAPLSSTPEPRCPRSLRPRRRPSRQLCCRWKERKLGCRGRIPSALIDRHTFLALPRAFVPVASVPMKSPPPGYQTRRSARRPNPRCPRSTSAAPATVRQSCCPSSNRSPLHQRSCPMRPHPWHPSRSCPRRQHCRLPRRSGPRSTVAEITFPSSLTAAPPSGFTPTQLPDAPS